MDFLFFQSQIPVQFKATTDLLLGNEKVLEDCIKKAIGDKFKPKDSYSLGSTCKDAAIKPTTAAPAIEDGKTDKDCAYKPGYIQAKLGTKVICPKGGRFG